MTPASYHNHTVYSDGRDFPETLAEAALRERLPILGISDHFCLETDGAATAPPWSLQPAKVDTYIDHILSLARPGLATRAGIEFDWLDGSADRLRPYAAHPRLDYTIGSVHYIGQDAFDVNRSYWETRTPEAREDLFRRYWIAVRDMASSRLFTIAGHLDLIKKFAYHPAADLTPLIHDALDAISQAGMAVELNTSGWLKDCAECYPAPAILAACRRRNIPVTISSDSHQARHLTHAFTRAAELLTRIGYRKIARFHRREIILEAL